MALKSKAPVSPIFPIETTMLQYSGTSTPCISSARNPSTKRPDSWLKKSSSFSSFSTELVGTPENTQINLIEESSYIQSTKTFPSPRIRPSLSVFLQLKNHVTRKIPETVLSLENFNEMNHLCYGSRSELYRAHYNQQPVIVKVLNILKNDDVAQQEFENEILCLSYLSHTNVIKMYGSGYSDSHTIIDNQQTKIPFIVLELLSGHTLAHHLSLKRPFHRRPFTESRYLLMIKELADVLRYLHYYVHSDYIIIHRDLKPDNIGFTIQGTLKLLDFGLSTCIRRQPVVDDNEIHVYELSGNTGSIRYMAPEVALNHPYNEKVDIYSFGMIVYEIITGLMPFKGYSRDKFYTHVIHGNTRPRLDYDVYYREIKVHENIRELIRSAWDVSAEKRPNSEMCYSIITQTEIIIKNKRRNLFYRFYEKFRNRTNSI